MGLRILYLSVLINSQNEHCRVPLDRGFVVALKSPKQAPTGL